MLKRKWQRARLLHLPRRLRRQLRRRPRPRHRARPSRQRPPGRIDSVPRLPKPRRHDTCGGPTSPMPSSRSSQRKWRERSAGRRVGARTRPTTLDLRSSASSVDWALVPIQPQYDETQRAWIGKRSFRLDPRSDDSASSRTWYSSPTQEIATLVANARWFPQLKQQGEATDGEEDSACLRHER